MSEAPTEVTESATLFGDDVQAQAAAAAASDDSLLDRLTPRSESDSAELPPQPLLLAAARACGRSHAPYSLCRCTHTQSAPVKHEKTAAAPSAILGTFLRPELRVLHVVIVCSAGIALQLTSGEIVCGSR